MNKSRFAQTLMIPSRVDTREPEVLWQPLVRMGWQRDTLAQGDYELTTQLEANPLIERKSVAQLLADMSTGILIIHTRKLVNATAFPILLIEGHWRMAGEYILDTNYTWAQAWNQLETIQDMGCRIQITTCISHTLERLVELEKYYQKDIHESAYRKLAGDNRLACLCLIPGIGIEKAKLLLTQNQSLTNIAVATIEDLVKVKGIGKTLAGATYNFFHEGGT